MPQKTTKFAWTKARLKAGMLVAEDDMSDEAIADACEVNRSTLARWKEHPEFVAYVAEIVRQLEAETLKFAIAKRRKRVAALQDRWERMRQVIDERAANEDLGAYRTEYDEETGRPIERHLVPGWTTGLLVRKDTQHTVEFKVDTGLLAELRAHEEQAAKELGQWIEKNEQSGPNGGPIQMVNMFAGMSDDELEGRIAELEAQRAAGIRSAALRTEPAPDGESARDDQ